MKNKLLLLFSLFIITAISLQSDDNVGDVTRLLRFPNSSKTQITFNYGGNIYVAPIAGGLATKLTSFAGIEQMGRFSPDGKTIAFVAQYDGNPEIYTISATGGSPKRVTYAMDQSKDVADRQGPNNIIMQWTGDGKQILYRARKDWWSIGTAKLYKTNIDGSGLPVELPVPKGGYASLSADGSKMAYNQIFREFRTWKRYRGGQADDIWLYDFGTKELTNVTNNPAQDIMPMWSGNKIYFASDRTNTMNLYCYDLSSKQTKQITHFDKYDVKFPSLGAEHIAFENGGTIYLMSLATEEVKAIDIKVVDDEIAARSELVNVKNRVSALGISPDGKRALLNARGEIFIVPSTVPNAQSVTLNITNTSGVHERNATWSPKGDWIAYISDKTGNEEVWVMQPDGKNATQLTNNSTAYRYGLQWSPDGSKLLNSDNARNLIIIDVASKTEKVIYHSLNYAIQDFDWSPDNKWIAYKNEDEQGFGIIYLYSLKDGKSYAVTNNFYNSDDVVFSKDGKYLFFASDRDFNAIINALEWNFAYSTMGRIYGICLQKDEPSPFKQFVDYNAPVVEEKKLNKKEKEVVANADIIVDLDGIESRLFVLPGNTARYYGLKAMDKLLYYYRDGTLYFYDFDGMEQKEVGSGYYNITFTPDGKNVLFSKGGGEYYLNKRTEKLNTKDGLLDLSGMTMNLNRKEEWQQVFNESWRQFKQFFYDANMHGVDWQGMHDKYGELLPYVTHRNDLTYIIGEMIGELNAGHCYVTSGEMPRVAQVGIGLLGIDLQLEQGTNMYKITRILRGQNWDNTLRSPLTEPSLNIKDGGYIIAIDDNKLTPEVNPYSYLVGKENKIVKLTINNTASATGSHDVFVKTIDNESELRYYNWIEDRKHIVDSVSNGRIGYVHIPDMGVGNGLNWFAKYWYPQVRKEGLIIDDRYNGGGNVSPMIIERLRRELTMVKIGRNNATEGTIPSAVMTGPIVCLINENSMSDGDMFPFQFKASGIGPVIGKRSWGGVVGIYGSLPLLDGSSINKPEVSNFGAKSGNWELEGVGMVPDFEVNNHPAKEYAGIDEQLLFAIDKVFELMKTSTKTKIPPVPPYPIKK
ncbi:MAG: PDZ domain-containing protein [Ignavibacteria bacterium]|jgi:tricorn protease|nr:PDZ domain-containing protein [Ignavibacteria bacterium]